MYDNKVVTEVLYLSISAFAVYFWDDSKESLELTDGPCSVVDRGGVLVHKEILERVGM